MKKEDLRIGMIVTCGKLGPGDPYVEGMVVGIGENSYLEVDYGEEVGGGGRPIGNHNAWNVRFDRLDEVNLVRPANIWRGHEKKD